MSDQGLQIPATVKFCDAGILAAEQKDTGVLSPVVPGSRLHEVIHNPIDSRIDEGLDSRWIPPSLTPSYCNSHVG